MSLIRANAEEVDAGRRKIFIAVGLLTALIVAGLVYWTTRPAARVAEPRLEGAARDGSPEFAQMADRIVIEFNPDQDASEATRAAGDVMMWMRPRVRNFTGRTLAGLELKATVVDLDGRVVRERTVVVIPTDGREELENNKVAEVLITMEAFRKDEVRANIRIEKTAFKLK